MTGIQEGNKAREKAGVRPPAFLFGGCIGGLLLGVIFHNIPYGVAGGLLLSLLTWRLGSNRSG